MQKSILKTDVQTYWNIFFHFDNHCHVNDRQVLTVSWRENVLRTEKNQNVLRTVFGYYLLLITIKHHWLIRLTHLDFDLILWYLQEAVKAKRRNNIFPIFPMSVFVMYKNVQQKINIWLNSNIFTIAYRVSLKQQNIS